MYAIALYKEYDCACGKFDLDFKSSGAHNTNFQFLVMSLVIKNN